jgi:DNA-binding protein Fis
MQDEALALDIVEAVVAACAPAWRARDAEDAHRLVRRAQERAGARARRRGAGVQMVTVHGRTREQGYRGEAEHDTVAAGQGRAADPGGGQRRHRFARQAARAVLAATGADALMIGRAAQGRPWIFATSPTTWPPGATWRRRWCWSAPRAAGAPARPLRLYGEHTGVRSARKHIGWYVRGLPGGEAFRAEHERIDSAAEQWRGGVGLLRELADTHERLPRLPRKKIPLPLVDADEPMTSSPWTNACATASRPTLRDLGGTETPGSMYDMMVVKLVEKPLLDVVMQHCAGNQSRAAEWLGMNRNTLRKKLHSSRKST